MMTRMFGFCCGCADAGWTIMEASDASRASRMFQLLFIVDLPTKWLLDRLMVSGRPVGRPHHPQASELLARVRRCLLELFHDLIQVVARRILKRGELPVGFQLLEPQHLADGQQVPVVYVSRDRPGESAAEPETRLFLVAPRRLEWIALEVYHAGRELGLDSRDVEARRGFRRDREIHLPIFVAHRGRVRTGIVEEGVARRFLGLSLQVVALIDAIERRLDDPGIAAGFDLLLQAVALGATGDVDERGQ